MSNDAARTPCPFPMRVPACCRPGLHHTTDDTPRPEPIEIGQWRAVDPKRRPRRSYPCVFIRRQVGDGMAAVPWFDVALCDAEGMQRSAARASASYVLDWWPIVLRGRPGAVVSPELVPQADPIGELKAILESSLKPKPGTTFTAEEDEEGLVHVTGSDGSHMMMGRSTWDAFQARGPAPVPAPPIVEEAPAARVRPRLLSPASSMVLFTALLAGASSVPREER